jgi:hypothetical protein
MDLAQLADQDPAALINLLSSRHRRFALLSKPDPARRALEENLYYTVFKELQRMLSQEKTKNLPGAREVLADLSELRRQFIASLTTEERLEGLRPEERLQGLRPEEILARLRPDERLQGLRPEERLQGLRPEERLQGLRPEEILEGLGPKKLQELPPEVRARLRALLNNGDSE